MSKARILFIGLIPALLLSACTSFENVKTDETPYFRRAEIEDPKRIVSQEAFAKALAAIPKGSKVLVEEEYRPLLPAGLALCDYYRFYEPYRYPDTRIDPFAAAYLLAHESLYLQAILAPPKIWERVISTTMTDKRTVSLLRRVESLNESLLSSSPVKGLDQTVRIPAGEMEGISFALFDIDRFEVSHYEYAAFLNDAQVPVDNVDRYYSLKDPTSKIVHYQGRYRVLTGYSTIPVFNVSWFGAKAYCRHFDKHLPRKEQWLMAAGRADGRLYPWGNQTDFRNRGNFDQVADGFTLWAPVDAFPQGKSPRGVYNMSGNLYEWTESQELMGGCMEFGPETARLDRREVNSEMARNIHDGFRCVR